MRRGVGLLGDAENKWSSSTMDELEGIFKAARARGVPVFAASGDAGSRDGSGAGDQADFPASAPSAIGCGGTRLTVAGAERSSEVTWDDDDKKSATGGGVSKHFPGRDVPDVAGNADPETGYEVLIDGKHAVVGGTSAVAPLMLGMHALLWELNGGRAFDLLNVILTHPQTCFDVTIGDNGGFRAGPGRDEVTGFGVPDGGRLADVLAYSPPSPVSLTNFPTAQVISWLEHNHAHTHAELAAADAIVDWAAANGINLKSA